MPIAFRSNIASLHAQTELNKTTNALAKTFERLSSGLRINSASDDPAGLAVADMLRSQARVAGVAIRNAHDGISLTSVADSALGTVSSILSRMGELAEQGASGTYTMSQRSALSSEFLALGSEIDRIAKTTEFNNNFLLSNSSAVTLQVGLTGATTSQITITAVQGTLDVLGLAGTGSSSMCYSILDVSTAGAQFASLKALSAVQNAIDSLNTRRGTIGAAESRLSFAVDYLMTARENILAAESRIRDADVAQEVADMVRLQVLQQAGTAVLAQANQQPQVVLRLLQ